MTGLHLKQRPVIIYLGELFLTPLNIEWVLHNLSSVYISKKYYETTRY